jgi:subfamily B ATP-binding cassette protein HlyB/CyaB
LDIHVDAVGQNAPDSDELRRSDAGIKCLAALLRFHGLPADPATLTHQLGAGDAVASQDDLVRLARRQGLKARAVGGRGWDNLAKTPLPAIARRIDGNGFVILAKIA